VVGISKAAIPARSPIGEYRFLPSDIGRGRQELQRIAAAVPVDGSIMMK
jgi:hypothetical protein